MPLDSDLSPFADPFGSPSPRPHRPRAGWGARALALVGGLAALVLVLRVTIGTALVALLGMAVAWAIARRRGRPLTRGASWWGASLSVTLGFAALTAVMIAKAPPGTMRRIRQSNDSLVAASPPPRPPEWLKRIDPTGGRSSQLSDSASQRIVRNPAFLVWVAVMSAMFVSVLIGAIVGTLGWGVTLLFAFAATGRWPPGESVRGTAI